MASSSAVNPYAGHPECSELEAEVLWEYSKLAGVIRRIDNLAKETAENPNDKLLNDLRALEKKMGLVLTLFKASVWAMITDNEAAEEQRKLDLEIQRRREELSREESRMDDSRNDSMMHQRRADDSF